MGNPRVSTRLDTGKKDYVRRAYARTSRIYDKVYLEEQYEKYFVALKRVKPRGIVLDAGCGTCLLLEYILVNRLGDNIDYYVGLDISPHMLVKAMDRVRSRGYHKVAVLDLVEADIEYLPFRNKVFDTVYSFTVLDLLENTVNGFNMLRLSCRGSLVVSFLKKVQVAKRYMPVAHKIGETDKDVILGLHACNTYAST